MPKIGDFRFTSIMAQFIGPPGTGKSVAAASFHEASKDRPTYIFDLHGKIRAIEIAFPGAPIEYDIFRINQYPEFQRKFNELQRLTGNARPKTIIVDDYTALADMLLEYAKTLRGNDSNRKKENDATNRGVLNLNTLDDYKVEATGFLKIINCLKEKEYDDTHRIMITHMYEYDKENLDGSKEHKVYTSAGAQKLGAKIPGYFEEVYKFFTKGAKTSNDATGFFIETQNSGDDIARSIIPGMPKHIDFTRRKENPEGSLWKELEKILKEKGYL